MSILAWVLHGFLSVAFLGAGGAKIAMSKDALYENGMVFVEDFSQGQVRMIGVLEVLGAIGVTIPVAIGVLPIMSGVAAAGLLLTMIAAAATHIKRGEFINVTGNVILGGIAGYVAYMHLM